MTYEYHLIVKTTMSIVRTFSEMASGKRFCSKFTSLWYAKLYEESSLDTVKVVLAMDQSRTVPS